MHPFQFTLTSPLIADMSEFLMVSKYGIRLVFDLMRVVFLTKFEEVKLSSDNWARL